MSNGLIATVAAWLSKVKTDVAAILVDTAVMQPLISTNLDAKISEVGGAAEYNSQAFTSNGTWTVPTGFAGVVYVTLVAGGGGGGMEILTASGGGGGGGGETLYRYPIFIKKSDTSSVSVTLGNGGTGAADGVAGAGGAGGNSTFGTFLTATRGNGGGGNGTNTGGTGGGISGGSGGAEAGDGSAGTESTTYGTDNGFIPQALFKGAYLGGGGGGGGQDGSGTKGGDGGASPTHDGGRTISGDVDWAGSGGASYGDGGGYDSTSATGESYTETAPGYGGGGHGGIWYSTAQMSAQAGGKGYCLLEWWA